MRGSGGPRVFVRQQGPLRKYKGKNSICWLAAVYVHSKMLQWRVLLPLRVLPPPRLLVRPPPRPMEEERNN